MKRLEGGYLGGRPTWSLASNPGIWGIEQVYARRAAGTWPIGAGSFDEFYEYVVLTLHADGANASTSFADSSLYGRSITVSGNAKVSTAQSRFGGASVYFDGSGDYLSIANQANHSVQQEDFTIEAWVYIAGNSPADGGGNRYGTIFSNIRVSGTAQPGWCFVIGGNTTTTGTSLYIENRINSTTAYSASSNAITITQGQWHHLAACRVNGIITFYFNGTGVGSRTLTSNTITSSGPLTIGRQDVPSYTWDFNGYIDDLRITKGYARYTSNFSVPTGPYEDEGVPLADPFYNYVSLLLPMNGSNNSTTFTDRSPNALTVTANGDAKLSTAVKRYGVSSAAFDGTGDYLALTGRSFSTSNFTVEGWIYVATPASGFVILDTRDQDLTNSGFAFYVRGTSKLALGTGSPFVATEGPTTITANSWHHVALVRSSGTIKGYLNGVEEFSVANTASLSLTGWRIGSFWNAPTISSGYIDDLRITNGVARYTANFIPPLPHADYGTLADPYLAATSLLMPMEGPVNSTGFFDRAKRLPVTTYGNAKISNAQYKWGLTSAYFDGSGDGLVIPTSSDFDFGAGDFTIELWVNATILNGAAKCIATKGWISGGFGAWMVYITTANDIVFYSSSNNTSWDVASSVTIVSAPQTNRWYHIAVTRSGTTFRTFADGVQTNTFTSSASLLVNSGHNIGIGADRTGTATGYAGYIDDLRIIKGHARYTTSFTPPTAPINADTSSDPYLSNVSLLLKMDGENNSTTFTDSSLTPKAVFANGDAKISTAQSKFGGSSALFDGTGDYLSIASDNTLSLDANNFTIEAWIYLSAKVNNYGTIIGNNPATFSSGATFFMAYGASSPANPNKLGFGTFTTNPILVSTTSLDINNWYHVAVTRDGTAVRLFINGTHEASATNSESINLGLNGTRIGSNGWDGSASFFQGYIDDLRITKGIARYTANFIPPTISHPVWSETDASFSSVSLLLNGNGANASTVVADRSSNSLTLVPNGNAQISTTQSRFGGSSLYFDGAGDYISVQYSSLFAFGADNFTLEAWIYRAGVSANTSRIWSAGADVFGEVEINIDASGVLTSFGTTNGTAWNAWSNSSITPITANTWTHIALVRSGGTVTMYVNGIGTTLTSSLGPAALATGTGGSNIRTIGGQASPDRPFNGYIDDLRVTKGVARYTTNFTPPIAPHPIPVIDPYFGAVSLLLHMNGANASTTFPDHSYNALAVTANGNAQISTAQSKFGGASALFDGTGDWLSVSTNTVLNLAGVNFTIEAWIYISGLFTANIDGNRVGTILAYGSTTTNQGYELIINQTGNTFALQSNGTANGAFASYTFNTNQWYHVAATRSGSVSQLFVDGQALTLSTNTFPNNSSSNGTLKIGAERLYTGYNHDFNGYIDDLRITKGIARYTSNFTPPTTQFPNS